MKVFAIVFTRFPEFEARLLIAVAPTSSIAAVGR